MITFGPETLLAAKDVGLPISVLVGILAIFAAIVQLKDVHNQAKFFSILACGMVAVAVLVFVFWISTREVYQWVDTKAYADWVGNDEGWTDSAEPLGQYCDRSREGTIASCWSNRPEGYPTNVIFHGTQGNGQWCAYKIKEKIGVGKADGGNTARVYICVRVSL